MYKVIVQNCTLGNPKDKGQTTCDEGIIITCNCMSYSCASLAVSVARDHTAKNLITFRKDHRIGRFTDGGRYIDSYPQAVCFRHELPANILQLSKVAHMNGSSTIEKTIAFNVFVSYFCTSCCAESIVGRRLDPIDCLRRVSCTTGQSIETLFKVVIDNSMSAKCRR